VNIKTSNIELVKKSAESKRKRFLFHGLENSAVILVIRKVSRQPLFTFSLLTGEIKGSKGAGKEK
jgi:hypothetical protein